MRCYACNKNLSDFESTRKYSSGEYVDMCNDCWYNSQMYMDNNHVIERDELNDIVGTDNWEDSMPLLQVER